MLIDDIRNLYLNDKLNSREVGERLGVSQWCVISAMRRNNIPRRTSAESNNINFLKSPLSYNKKASLTESEERLRTAALMLYWAEGSKKGKWVVDFTNSDGKMVLIFLKVLREIYRVKEEKLRVGLYCYKNQDPKELINYWSQLLKIPTSQFIKPYVRENYNEKNKDVMPHALVHIRYADKRLFVQIKSEIDKIQHDLNMPSWWSGQSHLPVEEAP